MHEQNFLNEFLTSGNSRNRPLYLFKTYFIVLKCFNSVYMSDSGTFSAQKVILKADYTQNYSMKMRENICYLTMYVVRITQVMDSITFKVNVLNDTDTLYFSFLLLLNKVHLTLVLHYSDWDMFHHTNVSSVGG